MNENSLKKLKMMWNYIMNIYERDSVYTAGYDIYLLEGLTIKQGERKKF